MGLSDRIRRMCERPSSDRALRDQALAEIARPIPYDAHVFALTDPVSGVVSSPHATVPMVPAAQLPRLIEQRYARADLDDWAGWLSREFGVVDVVRIDLRDKYGGWGFLELWRASGHFADDDRSTLDALARLLTAGLRTAVAGYFRPPGDAGPRPPAIEPGVILLDRDLRVQSETDAAATALLRLLPAAEDVPPVPAVAFNVGAALLAAERTSADAEGIGEAQAWTRVHLGGGLLMTARADRMDGRIAVSISPCTSAERADLFERAHGLSPREVEVLSLVLEGQDSREIAAALTIAPTTAEDHLRALLAKTGSRSRQHLVVRALGG